MNAIDLLTHQHRHIEHLFDRLGRIPTSEGAARGDVFAQLADALATHIALEEENLYPRAAAFRRPDAQSEALAEHELFKQLLADLLQCEPGEPEFEVKLFELRDRLELHVEEEEAELFPALEQLIEEPELLELGLAMAEQARERSLSPEGEITPALEPSFS